MFFSFLQQLSSLGASLEDVPDGGIEAGIDRRPNVYGVAANLKPNPKACLAWMRGYFSAFCFPKISFFESTFACILGAFLLYVISDHVYSSCVLLLVLIFFS